VKLKIKNDFSWHVWLAVLALHTLAFVALNAALTLSRLDAAPPLIMQAFIIPPDAPAAVPAPKTVAAKSMQPELVAAQVVSAVQAEPAEATEPEASAAAPEPQPTVPPDVPKAALPERYVPPDSIRLLYTVTKGDDSAKASLAWRVQNNAAQQTSYELAYEATYFGISVQRQTSAGVIGERGLAPVRFGDKRRGKAEQATHFDSGSQRVTFSNNRPEAVLTAGSQDRSSVLIQLASLFAAQPSKWQAGQVIEIPVASTDELETWRFEVQGEELLALPAGQLPAVHLIRRARRAFDQTVELWLAPSLSYLPVRMRQSDTSGLVDVQLLGSEKL
jgi:hypothetical protein